MQDHHVQYLAIVIILFFGACSSRSGPGPSCSKLLELLRASCSGNGPMRIQGEGCQVVEALHYSQRPQTDWDEAESFCEAETRALEEPPALEVDQALTPGDASPKRWESAMTYKFVGVLDVLIEERDARSATDQ